jgi:ferredoxin-NADP reductase
MATASIDNPRQAAGPLGRRALELAAHFTTPLLPDDYLELVNPLWSTRELRGRVQSVTPECVGAVSVRIKPGIGWEGHRPGQYVRVGVEIEGVHHWRAYSLTSAPRAGDGCIAITPKLVHGGTVSPYLCERVRRGTIVRLGDVEGSFVLPSPLPQKLLFLSAGSGVTPIASMVRSLADTKQLADVVHVHSVRRPEEFIFGAALRALAARVPGYRLHVRLTASEGRLGADGLERLCADWRQREAFICGPAEMIDSFRQHWQADADPDRLHVERFGLDLGASGGTRGQGGTVEFCSSGVDARSDGAEPILLTGERAGAELPYGCRMGICNSCAGRLRSGSVRDLRTGRVHGQPGELVRTCVNAPEGPIEIEL